MTESWSFADCIEEEITDDNASDCVELDEPLEKRGDAGSFRLTDLGNAQRLAARAGDRLRFSRGVWFAWDGRRWQRDESGLAPVVEAKAVVGALYAEAAELAKAAAAGDEEAGERATRMTRWAGASSRLNSVRAMVELAKSEAPIAVNGDAFDRDRWLLNVENGTVDLRTGTLRPHAPSDMITHLAPVVFDPAATCPRWIRTLERILPDSNTRAWVQRYAGYALTGDVGEQVLMFAYGTGANGKSVLLDVLLSLMGDYGLRAAADLVVAKGETHPTELADLEGRRLVIVSEIDLGQRWAESTIKRITGDQTITARRMRQDFYTFPATHKLVIAANTKPAVRGADHAIWRRMRLVPFEVTIPPGERDKGLINTLVNEESAGILNWAIEGCLSWQREGLGEAKAVNEATEQYASDQDTLGQWIGDECHLGSEAWTQTTALYTNYAAWCVRQGHEPKLQPAFRSQLLERPGIKESRRGIGRGLTGIALHSARVLASVG